MRFLQGLFEVFWGEGLRVLASAVRAGAGACAAAPYGLDGTGSATGACGLFRLGVARVLCCVAGEANCGRLVEVDDETISSMHYTPLRTSPSSSLASRIFAGRSLSEMLAPMPLSTHVSSSSWS